MTTAQHNARQDPSVPPPLLITLENGEWWIRQQGDPDREYLSYWHGPDLGVLGEHIQQEYEGANWYTPPEQPTWRWRVRYHVVMALDEAVHGILRHIPWPVESTGYLDHLYAMTWCPFTRDVARPRARRRYGHPRHWLRSGMRHFEQEHRAYESTSEGS